MAQLTKLLLAGALALSIAACHEPGHVMCDDSGNRPLCIALIAGAAVTFKALAIGALTAEEPL